MNKRILSVCIGLILVTVGCARLGQASAPCTVTVSQQAANRLVQRVAQQASVRGKPITISATNDEVSSLLRQYLAEAKKQNPNDFIPLDNPTVCFEDHTMILFGTVQWGANNPVDAVITINATVKSGKPDFKVQQIQLGPLSVPPDLSDELTRLINGMVGQYMGPITMTEIKMQLGQITLTGQVR